MIQVLPVSFIKTNRPTSRANQNWKTDFCPTSQTTCSRVDSRSCTWIKKTLKVCPCIIVLLHRIWYKSVHECFKLRALLQCVMAIGIYLNTCTLFGIQQGFNPDKNFVSMSCEYVLWASHFKRSHASKTLPKWKDSHLKSIDLKYWVKYQLMHLLSHKENMCSLSKAVVLTPNISRVSWDNTITSPVPLLWFIMKLKVIRLCCMYTL